jgi:N,N-dimethylformamidase beta subunit-like, C-terminal
VLVVTLVSEVVARRAFLAPAAVLSLLLISGCTAPPHQTSAQPSPAFGKAAASVPSPHRETAHPTTPKTSTTLSEPAPTSSEPSHQPRSLRGSSDWRLTKPAMAGEIEGFANPGSVTPGGDVRLMVSTTADSFRADAYRIGGYRGGAGRLIWSSKRIPGVQQPLPTLLPRTRTIVARWPPSLTARTAGWPPGFYLIKLIASSGYQAFVPFTVQSPSTRGRIVLVEPNLDWEAYNEWGGYSLYTAPAGAYRSWAVSFDRPNVAPGANQFLYNILPAVVLAERAGLPLAYEDGVDVATRPSLLDGAAGYVSVGHDEYWTVPERRYVTRARNDGTNLAFLSSNTMYWRVRLAQKVSGPNRLIVAYKSDAATQDPLRNSHPRFTTARWRDSPGANPENSITGTLYECYPVDEPYRIASPEWWGFRGTGVHAGTQFPHLVAEEADRVYPIPSTPHPLQVLSYRRYDCGGSPTSTQSSYYTTTSGAGVIDFGTQRWTCALGNRCPGLPPRDDSFARRVTLNVLRAFAKGPVGFAHPAHENLAKFRLPAANEVPAS